MQKIQTILIFVLGLVVLSVLVVAMTGTVFLLANTSENLELYKRLGLLPATAISAGVLVAILTFSRERRKHELETQRHVSEVMLERAKALILL